MWFPVRSSPPDWTSAVTHLRRDPVLRAVIAGVGGCQLAPRRDRFAALCASIFTQQISTAVAATLFTRFRTLFPLGRPTAARLLGLSDEQLAWAGLSRQKRVYLRDLATQWEGSLRPVRRRLAAMSDEQIIVALDEVKGVGRWTAEMFLIFVMNRPDVLPVDDFGLRKSVQTLWSKPQLPTPREVTALAEPWRPWRSIATWYLWRGAAIGAART